MAAVLSLLRIKNLALVEDLEWELAPGFTAITGETGAGKSIIIGALKLLLGERADKSLIRTGAEACTVEAIFAGDDFSELNRRLEESGVEPADGELLVKRSFSLGGSNRQFVNGSPATLALLKMIGDELVDLHGPHDHQSLLSPERQLALLDGFAHAEPAVAGIPGMLSPSAGTGRGREVAAARPNRHARRSSTCSGTRSPRLAPRASSLTKRRKFLRSLPAGDEQQTIDRTGERDFAAAFRDG